MYDASGAAKSVSVKDACLGAHNKVRALHQGTPPLKHDDALAKEVRGQEGVCVLGGGERNGGGGRERKGG
jgi:hypothetical protein